MKWWFLALSVVLYIAGDMVGFWGCMILANLTNLERKLAK